MQWSGVVQNKTNPVHTWNWKWMWRERLNWTGCVEVETGRECKFPIHPQWRNSDLTERLRCSDALRQLSVSVQLEPYGFPQICLTNWLNLTGCAALATRNWTYFPHVFAFLFTFSSKLQSLLSARVWRREFGRMWPELERVHKSLVGFDSQCCLGQTLACSC